MVIIGGGIDLSSGSTMAFAGIMTAMMLSYGFGVLVSILIGLGFGVFIGFINGILVSRQSFHPYCNFGYVKHSAGILLRINQWLAD